MKIKKIIGSTIAVVMMLTCVMTMLPAMLALANETYSIEYYQGDKNSIEVPDLSNTSRDDSLRCRPHTLMISIDDEKEFMKKYGIVNDMKSSYNTGLKASLPKSKDLSNSQFFSGIRSSGSYMKIGPAIATTEYQFTYEANKLNNINTNNSNIYGACSVYNYICGGNNNPITVLDAYDILANLGAVTKSEMNIDPCVPGYKFNLPSNDSKVNALNTRIDSVYEQTISGYSTAITSPSSSALLEIKQLINSGKMPIVEMKLDSTTSNCKFKNIKSSTEKALCWSVEPNNFNGDCEAVAVVGYNDTIACDINGDGNFQVGEYGAFKIALTDGYGFGNNGYMWVMYDALNKKSSNNISNQQNNNSSTRIPVFQGQTCEDNKFYFINVKNHNVNLIGKLHFNTQRLNKLKVTLFRNKYSGYSSNNIVEIFTGIKRYRDYYKDYTTDLMLDFSNLDDSEYSFTSGDYFGFKIENINSNYKDDFTNVNLSLIDNLHNNIYTFTASELPLKLSNGVKKTVSHRFGLIMGDINYDQKIDEDDVDILIDYNLNGKKISNIQLKIADLDDNKCVELNDLIILRKMLKSPKAIAKIDTFVQYYKLSRIEDYKKLSERERCMSYDEINEK